MIYLGYSDLEKRDVITEYVRENAVQHAIIISGMADHIAVDGCELISFPDVIRYVVFYRLLQEIEPYTLIVIDECLRTQNRYDLAYNCIRNYLNHTDHVLIFQALPLIDTSEDFMILFDFATHSQWKRRHFDPTLIHEHARVHMNPWPLAFRRIDVPTSAATKRKYERERERRFAELGARDPHTLPRNLYLIGGKDKLNYIRTQDAPLFASISESTVIRHYVARNRRLRHERIITYREATKSGGPYGIVELPHRFIDFVDFVVATEQTTHEVLVADLKVDHWYYNRYVAWSKRVHATYTDLQQ